MMDNIAEYSIGFLEGLEKGKKQFMQNLAEDAVESLKEFVDSNARTNPKMLQHMYEWYQSGNANARLFDFSYVVNDAGIKIASSFSQSRSIQSGSKEPFYNKAEIMEKGMSVIIKPKKASTLAFIADGREVFSKTPVVVNNPGGIEAQGSFDSTIKMFFEQYFSQAFLNFSGIRSYLEKPTGYKKSLRAGSKEGRSAGINAGREWISNAGRIIQ